MSQFNSLLVLLSDGKRHLLADLAEDLGVDFSALKEMLAQMQSDGLELQDGDQVRWLDPVPPLSVSEINQAMSANVEADILIEYQVESTNTLLRDNFQHGRICLAEMQTVGRGRRGRKWLSPPAKNIYLSLGWFFDEPIASLGGLSLAVGMKMVESLQPLVESPLSVKWPNDIYFEDKKLAGILIESAPRGANQVEVVIGIGVNVLMQTVDEHLDQPWTSLAQHQQELDRNRLVAAILDQLPGFLTVASEGSAATVIERYVQTQWAEHDLTIGREVTIVLDGHKIQGTGAGIDDSYNFVLDTVSGTKSFCSGDVSLRLNQGDLA